MALIFHLKCTVKCRLEFVSVWTCLKFCCLVMGYRVKDIVRKGEIVIDTVLVKALPNIKTLDWSEFKRFAGGALIINLLKL